MVIRVPKRHPLCSEIPENFPRNFEEQCTKDDVKPAQWNGMRINNETLLVNGDSSLLKESLTGHLIAISDCDSQATIGGERQPDDGVQLFVDEVMSAA